MDNEKITRKLRPLICHNTKIGMILQFDFFEFLDSLEQQHNDMNCASFPKAQTPLKGQVSTINALNTQFKDCKKFAKKTYYHWITPGTQRWLKASLNQSWIFPHNSSN